MYINFISRFCWDSNYFQWHNSYQGLLKKIQFPPQNAHAPDEIFQRLNYIFWNNMDIISLHKMMYTSFEQKKTPWRGTKSSIRIYSHCNWIDRFDFKLYIFISKHFFDPLLAMILFEDEIFKVIFFNITQDRIRKNIQDFEPNSEDNVCRLIYNRAKNNSWSFLIRHKKNCFELRLHARFENILQKQFEK